MFLFHCVDVRQFSVSWKQVPTILLTHNSTTTNWPGNYQENQLIDLGNYQERLLHLKTCFNTPFDPQFKQLFHIDRHAAEEQRLQTSSQILRFRSKIGKSVSFTYLAYLAVLLDSVLSDIQGREHCKTHFQFSSSETSVVGVPCNCGLWALGDKSLT